MEMITGLVFTRFYRGDFRDILLFIIVSVLLVIAYVDYETMMISDGLLLMILMLSVLYLLFYNQEDLYFLVLGMISVSGIMGLLNLIKRDCFGMGDIKLMAIIGLLLGFDRTINAALIATLSAGTIAVIIKCFYKSENKYLPFAPFLVLGIIINIFR